MAESLTISRQAPAIKSMNYALLREQGIARLQKLAGKVWNDFNIHDPGVTILEALAYAITDLGYRSSYKMQDILALAPGDSSDIRNFFTAYEILTNRSLTLADYRKLMMDVEITDAETGVKAGIKNAWLLKADMQEVPFYIHPAENALSYFPDPAYPGQTSIKLRGLYNVNLELDSNDRFGDMNESLISGVMKVVDDGNISDNRLLYRNIIIEADMPRWDTPGIDWNSQTSIRAAINKKITLDFSDYPDNYIFYYYADSADGSVYFSPDSNPPPMVTPTDSYSGADADRDGVILAGAESFSYADMQALSAQINDFLFNTATGLIAEYQRKVKIIRRLVDEVCKTLMANRNLCEDFISFNTVRIEEISMCGEIQVEAEADIEEVLAMIYYKIGEFLAPTVYFRTIEELMAKGYTSDQIFDGPRLRHGFIDSAELNSASIREVIHVSDLYQIIMDVPGVVAVRNLQIANIPESTLDNIVSQSVKWCLSLAFDKNYIPRISPSLSNITFFKDVLPFEAKETEVLERLAELRRTDRNQRLDNPVLDLPVPQGNYKSIDDYTSVQEEFPLVYGIGEVGLPDSASDLRKAQAHQLKGFLMFFDQLLVDYLAQLSHVKDLFSLNQELDANGNPVINRTYFTKTLEFIVPDVADLYVDSGNHADNLNAIAEDATLFENRRNRFLDHLMARFGETFSDYAMLAYTIDGPKAPEELIEDKLRFLNSYSDISYGRAGAFNYMDTCKVFSVDNLSGLEKRAALLAGIDPVDPSDLLAPDSIEINGVGPFSFDIVDSFNYVWMNSVNTAYETLDEILIAAEYAVTSGSFTTNYYFFDSADLNTPVDPQNPPPSAVSFRYKLYCGNEPIAISTGTFTSISFAELEIANTVAPLLFTDYEKVPSVNRKSLECGLGSNMNYDITIGSTAECPLFATVDFTILDEDGNDLLFYSVKVLPRTGEDATALTARINASADDILLEFLISAVNPDNYRLDVVGGNYLFNVFDKCGEKIATSAEINFNTNIAGFFSASSVSVFDQDGAAVAGTYTTNTATVSTNLVSLSLNTGLPVSVTGGKLVKNFTATISELNESRKTFVVNSDLRGLINAGDTITLTLAGTIPVTLAAFNETKSYTVARVHLLSLSPLVSEVTVKENFSDFIFASGSVNADANLPIISITNSGLDLVLRANVGELAIADFVYFLKTKFLSSEGFHLVEHILLRPLNASAKRFETATAATLSDTLAQDGSLYYARKLTITGINTVTKTFTVAGDITAELSFGRTILVTGSGLNNRTYTVLSVVLSGSDTNVNVVETIYDPTVAGIISYTKQVAIDSINPVPSNPSTITIAGVDLTAELNSGDVIIISGSENGRNDSRYIIALGGVNLVGSDTVITINSVEIGYQDKFLGVNQIEDCAVCRYEDPYSFVVSVIMPYWRGRFSNMAFREFFERTLRMECPAHIALNICWINCSQMETFEKAYRAWLYYHAQKERNVIEHTIAQNNLIDILLKLRTVYPTGSLHDCESGENLTGSIVLNQSVLGSI